MKIGANTAMKTRQDARKLSGFSGVWNSGESVQVFYPIFKTEQNRWDILVAEVWGYSINPKEFGIRRIFIPTNSEIVDGDPTTPDALYQFSRISPLFLKGEYEEAIAKVKSKASKLPESMMKQKLAEVDKEFQVEEGRIGKSPVVGRLNYVVSTEVVAVPLGEGGKPLTDRMKLVTQNISDDRIRKLTQIMNSSDMNLPDDATYLEVTYTFGTSGNRSMDARVTPVGALPGYRIEERFTNDWVVIKGLIDSLPESSDTIRKRNTSYRPVPENEIINAIKGYTIMNSDLLDQLQEEEDINRLSKNAKLLRSLALEPNHDVVKEALEDYDREQAEYEAKLAESKLAEALRKETSEGEDIEVPFEEAPTMESLISKEELEEARVSTKADEEDIIGNTNMSDEDSLV